MAGRPWTVARLEDFGRTQLSKTFFMRDFLYSEISQIEGISNLPDDPELAIEAGKHLCEEVLEQIQDRFGRIAVRSAFRSAAVNAKGAENDNQYKCASNEANYASHIWDHRDADGHIGATASERGVRNRADGQAEGLRGLRPGAVRAAGGRGTRPREAPAAATASLQGPERRLYGAGTRRPGQAGIPRVPAAPVRPGSGALSWGKSGRVAHVSRPAIDGQQTGNNDNSNIGSQSVLLFPSFL